jgi:ribosome maturation factor RimP
MQRKEIEAKVAELALAIVQKKSFELVDVEYVREGPNWYLRVFIDKEGGIHIDDCQVISEELGSALDEMDFLKQAYFLEVSSPGIDRPFKKEKDYQRNVGKIVEIKLFKPIDGNKYFEGELLGLEDDIVTVATGLNTELKFEKDKIASIRCKVIF